LHDSILVDPIAIVQERLIYRLTGTPKDCGIGTIAYVIKEPTIVVKALYESEVWDQ